MEIESISIRFEKLIRNEWKIENLRGKNWGNQWKSIKFHKIDSESNEF